MYIVASIADFLIPEMQVSVSAMLSLIFEFKYRYWHRFQIMCIGASLAKMCYFLS